MKKMRMESVDMTAQNIDKIAALFPNCMTETIDEQGKPKRAINFELLKQMLSDDVIEGDEAYEFTWVGKKAAIVEANKPIRKTLRPCPEESKNWDTTENLYIEGDNLEVLKLLQESYLGKVKMIYIDPPYNTGNDFIYRDDFDMSSDEYAEESGQLDEETGNRLFKNTDTNGRFHSDWCSMIYARLMLARNLLSEDGVIFISIDDNEQGNLKKICDDVFGSSNFYASIVWQKRTSPDARFNLGAAHDYILVYSKDWNILRYSLHKEQLSSERSAQYKNPDNDPRGVWASVDITGQTGHATSSQFYEITTPSGSIIKPPIGRCWALSQESFEKLVLDNRIWFGETGESRPRQKKFLSESEGANAWTWWTNTEVGHNQEGAKDLKELLGSTDIFQTPKPIKLLRRLINLSTNSDSIVLDFFSGSATTAHAVMQLNAEDGGKRKFIMVQLPETCDEKSEAYKAGYKNICEIGKERIRRAGAKILSEQLSVNSDQRAVSSELRTVVSEQLSVVSGQRAAGRGGRAVDSGGSDKPACRTLFSDVSQNTDHCPLTTNHLDTGFRVFKLDDTNMKDVYYSPDALDQMLLTDLVSNIKEDRNDLDLLFGCLLDWGLPLSMPYTSEKIEGCTVHTYNDGDLIACFDENIPESVITTIAKRKPLRAVFRDASFANSPAKINVFEIFKLYMPEDANDITKRVRVL